MKSVLLIIGAVIVIILLPATLTSIDDFRAKDQIATYNVDTGGGVTTATVTLVEDLFNDLTANVTISSNSTDDAPIASSYSSTTNVLTVSGLIASESRQLTVTYKIDALADYFGAGTGARVWPLMLVLGVIGIVVGAVYNATKHGE